MYFPGAAAVPKTQVVAPPQGQSLLVSGDNVRVQLDIDVFKAMQDGHGGWNESMAEVSLWCALIKGNLISITPLCCQYACTYIQYIPYLAKKFRILFVALSANLVTSD